PRVGLAPPESVSHPPDEVLRSRRDVRHAQGSRIYGAAGIRLGLEAPVVPSWFYLRLDGEVLAPIDPAAIEHNHQTVFQVDGWNAGLGLGALFTLGKP